MKRAHAAGSAQPQGRFGIFCIVPPHILREVGQRGSPAQRNWALTTLAISEQLRGRRSAIGAIALSTPTGEKRRTVYDAQHGSTLPGRRVRSEGEKPTGDPAVDEAYDALGATYDLYWTAFRRKSVDNRGLRLDGSVHFGESYDNAFWDGTQMVFGDGDGELFQRFTLSVDVIGHELTHGVTQHEAGLSYAGQSGALNESFSDVFGSLVKQRRLKQDAKDADWLIGQGLFTKQVRGAALRSMKAPGTAYDDPVLGKDPQPGHMKGYRELPYDNGGVHINSGIPNRAFYLAAIALKGRAWEKAGEIWYRALCHRLKRDSNFSDAAKATAQAAAELFGSSSQEEKSVEMSWKEVGV
jgi:Zn-dependent metalloprotease